MKCTLCGCELTKTNSKINLKSRSKQCNVCERKRIVAKQKEKQEVINAYKLGKGCRKCGYKEYACALDFHHINHNKKNKSISRMIDDNYSLDKIFKEIEKCELLCANCHRVHHQKERDNKTE